MFSKTSFLFILTLLVGGETVDKSKWSNNGSNFEDQPRNYNMKASKQENEDGCRDYAIVGNALRHVSNNMWFKNDYITSFVSEKIKIEPCIGPVMYYQDVINYIEQLFQKPEDVVVLFGILDSGRLSIGSDSHWMTIEVYGTLATNHSFWLNVDYDNEVRKFTKASQKYCHQIIQG